MKFTLSEPTFGSLNLNNPANSNGFSNQPSSQRWTGSFDSSSQYKDNYNTGPNIQPLAAPNHNFGAINPQYGRYNSQDYFGGNILGGSRFPSSTFNSIGSFGLNDRNVQVTTNSYPSITSNTFGASKSR